MPRELTGPKPVNEARTRKAQADIEAGLIGIARYVRAVKTENDMRTQEDLKSIYANAKKIYDTLMDDTTLVPYELDQETYEAWSIIENICLGKKGLQAWDPITKNDKIVYGVVQRLRGEETVGIRQIYEAVMDTCDSHDMKVSHEHIESVTRFVVACLFISVDSITFRWKQFDVPNPIVVYVPRHETSEPDATKPNTASKPGFTSGGFREYKTKRNRHPDMQDIDDALADEIFERWFKTHGSSPVTMGQITEQAIATRYGKILGPDLPDPKRISMKLTMSLIMPIINGLRGPSNVYHIRIAKKSKRGRSLYSIEARRPNSITSLFGEKIQPANTTTTSTE